MYCDLIPMPKGQFTYILFGLDAYSQYIYAVPIKDKTANAVLQGFLSLFAITGWYESLYLDNESSFQKAAGMLVRIAPMSIHYSSPYCHFQNNAENYIKSFKRTFLKILNDLENPQENKDWALLLPTVVQSLNRQVIQSLGVSRESLHYNTRSIYYPLAEIAIEANSDFDRIFDSGHPDVYAQVRKQRDKALKNSHKAKVPEFSENQIVFAVDKSPMTPGVSSILRLPTRGPFRINKIEQRNVSLVDLETGKEYSSHVELIRPLSLSEFKLLLSKKWDLNVQISKTPRKIQTRSSFEQPIIPMTQEEVKSQESEAEKEQEEGILENLFESNSQDTIPLRDPVLSEEEKPPDIGTENLIEPEIEQAKEAEMEFNSYGILEDVSPQYRRSILKKTKPTVRFLRKIVNFMYGPPEESESHDSEKEDY
jgi:hypothetical protein